MRRHPPALPTQQRRRSEDDAEDGFDCRCEVGERLAKGDARSLARPTLRSPRGRAFSRRRRLFLEIAEHRSPGGKLLARHHRQPACRALGERLLRVPLPAADDADLSLRTHLEDSLADRLWPPPVAGWYALVTIEPRSFRDRVFPAPDRACH